MIIKNLKNSREDMDLTQTDIGNILGVAKSTVCDWENGVHTIPLKHLIEYANHFNFSLDYLFGISRKNKLYYPLDIDLEIIAANLRKLRLEQGLTQVEVAKKLGTGQATYSHYENALYLILTSFLFNLYLIYGSSFSFDEILGRKEK